MMKMSKDSTFNVDTTRRHLYDSDLERNQCRSLDVLADDMGCRKHSNYIQHIMSYLLL